MAQSDSKKNEAAKDSEDLEALAESILEQEAQIHPCLGIYGGKNGNFEMIENGEEKTKPIEDKIHYLPLDTDIVKINAHTVRLTGYRDEVEDVGHFTLNASYVEFIDCPSLVKLPKMDRVNVAIVEDAPSLQIIPSVMNVRQLVLKKTGVKYLPKSLARTELAISECSNLQYIHPALSHKNIHGLNSAAVLAMQVNYMLSDFVPLEEKSQYSLRAKRVELSRPDVEVLPPCFGRAEITIGDCPNLQYIHPEVSVKQIHGISPERISRCKMNYLFKKLSDDDSRFDRWFKRVKREMKAQSRVR